MTIYGMEPGTTVSITPLATQTGLLNCWIDWNRDGDWADANEQIFDDEVILPPPDYTTLSIDVPANAANGYTYARYRFSTQPGLEFTGAAPDGEVEDHILMIGEAVGVDDGVNDLPKEFKLFQNYPNPFNPSTTIKFGLPEQGFVDLRVYNILGQEVAKLVNKELTAGYHEVNFGYNNITSGIYIYRIDVMGKYSSVKKMLLVK